MANIAVVGDGVDGTCSHVQTFFPNPTLTFSVHGTLLSGATRSFAGGQPIALRNGVSFPHEHCEGVGSTNQFHINNGASPVMVEGQPAAHVGDATTHCGGVGVITGPGVSNVFGG